MPATDRAARQQSAKPKRVATRRTLKAEERQTYYDARGSGANKTTAASMAGVTPKTAQKWEKQWIDAGNPDFDKGKISAPKRSRRDHSPAAREALDNFPVFQERYLGRVALPWQNVSAVEIVKLSKTPEKEFIVVNAPPGSGKSTLFTHDIPIWLIARNRGIRILILSSTNNNAAKFSDRIRKTLEATTPIQAEEEDIRDGVAKDAITTLSKDFGRFKPEESTTWTKHKFVVERPSEDAAHKDATVEAYGRDQDFLGGRFDIVICDDVYTPKNAKTLEAKNEIKTWFRTVAQSRLEPHGLLIVNMQRVDSEDLSNFCLEMEAFDLTDDPSISEEEAERIREEKRKSGAIEKPIRDGKRRKYRHMVFKAHFDDECKGINFHRPHSPAYPEGCLLYPRRLTYEDLKGIELTEPWEYLVWYQQEDTPPGQVLVDPVWIKGGRDEYGIERPGCWDPTRGARELPENLTDDLFSFLTIDPSPSQYWAIEWWIHHRPSNELYLIDLERRRMTSPEFFDMNPNTGAYSGILIDMYEASTLIGAPISFVVPEVNVAQKFMYEQSPMVQWMRMRSIAMMPHTTTAQNKNSQEFGVQGLQPWFRDGRIRLPGRQSDSIMTRTRSMKLVYEAERYRLDGDTSATTDCVMAAWFAIRAVGNFRRPKKELPREFRPGWMTQRPNLGVVA